MKTPRVGDKVVATKDIWDYSTKITIPAGTKGKIISAGIDAPYGLINVEFDYPGVTFGMPVWYKGYMQTVRLENV